ncbi:hypothetical protein AGMMS50239_23790 [Bacteroidia bacterium]|nr:hypothetical protein AGMMS50239_23790 [Bacteroidia bacterium]
MEVLDYIEPEIQTKDAENYRNNQSRFEELLSNSMSSEEFERRAIQHIIKLYEEHDKR